MKNPPIKAGIRRQPVGGVLSEGAVQLIQGHPPTPFKGGIASFSCLVKPVRPADSTPLKFTWQRTNQRGPIESYGLELNEKGVGKFQYKRREGDLIALDFELKPSTVEPLVSLFSQADFLNESKNFVSSRKVADMGMKTIRFENGSRAREVTFNYTENRSLQEIVNFFENLCQQEKSLFEMDLALKYDRLGIPKKLEELEKSLDAKRLVAPEQFGPVLEKICHDESLMNLARKEAKKILSKIEKMPSVAN